MEKWREVYTEEQIKRVQRLELQNLRTLIEICQKLDIKFFAYGGTLIGAVRHQGFVPWDDDLDIGMLRSDYNKFVLLAAQYLPQEYELQTPYNTPKTPYCYTKLRLKGTRYVEYGYHKLDIECGVYIDIYPIDNLPDDNKTYYQQFQKYQRLSKIYAWRQCPYLSCQSKSLKIFTKKVIKMCVSSALKVLPQKYLIKKIDMIATKFNDRETMRYGNYNFPKPTNVFYKLLPFENGKFEGYDIFLPGGWDAHLRARYGDYMTLPPEQERLGHKPYILDLGEY
ncbi:MAG: LicD family protein [Clostridia bacterium]|nr:LicD family protein [Clostridia bacterium]